MKAAVMREGTLVVDDVPDPVPGKGQLLVRTIACGICGSDLHFLKHAPQMVGIQGELGLGIMSTLDLDKDIVMGHEFSAEVLEIGPDSQGSVKAGDSVVSVPVMVTDLADLASIEPIGAYSNVYGGGYAEYMLLSSMMALKIPDGTDARHAALTEPMAVGLHALNKSGIKQSDAAVVLGAGPVGLAVISALARMGVEPIVAADFSPARRKLAVTMGAHEAVDPTSEPAVEAWRRLDGAKPLVIYEAVGVPGMLAQAMRDSPPQGRVLVVGACMELDEMRPLVGLIKELEVRFSFGYDPFEFSTCLQSIASGEVDVVPMITGHVGIDGVPGAFEALGQPDDHCKILVEPALG